MTASLKQRPRLVVPHTHAGGARSGDRRRLLVGLSLLAASLILLLISLNSIVITIDRVVWGGFILGTYVFALLMLILALRGKGYGPGSWRLGPWMLIYVAVMFGISSSFNLQNYQFGTSAQVILSYVVESLWLVAVGMTVWAASYLIGPGRVIGKASGLLAERLKQRYTSEVRSHLTPWLLYGIGSAARIVLLLTTARLGYVGDVAASVTTTSWYDHGLTMLGFCAPMGVATAVFLTLRLPARGSRGTAIVLILAEMAYALVSGLKASFIILIMAILIPHSVARGRVPRSILVMLTITFLVIVIPFTYIYRQNARPGNSTLSVGQAAGAAPQLLGSTLGGNDLLAEGAKSLNDLLNRGQYIVDIAIIMQRTPGQIPYLPVGKMFSEPASMMIPRALWPNKPIFVAGYDFGQEYLGMSAGEYTSTATTDFGSLYRFGGWVPLIAGMFLLGFMFRALDDIIDVRGNPHTMAIPLLTFQALVMAEQDWASILVSFVVFVPTWVLIVVLTFRPSRRTHA